MSDSVLDHWYVGNPIPAISSLAATDPIAARAFLSSGALDKIKGMQHSESAALRAVALMAVFQHAPANRPTALAKLSELAKTTRDETAAYLLAIAEITTHGIHKSAGSDEACLAIDALVANANSRESAEELLALKAIHCAAGGDGEAATAAATAASKIDETSASRFAAAVAALADGRATDAWLGFEDLTNEFGKTKALNAGRIASLLARGVADVSAEAVVEVSDEVGAANAAVACFRAGKSEEAREWLKKLSPAHPFSQALREAEVACSGFAQE